MPSAKLPAGPSPPSTADLIDLRQLEHVLQICRAGGFSAAARALRVTQPALSKSMWDHSAWQRREVINAGPDKVHINTRFARYRKEAA